MKINFTKKQFETLFKMVQYGYWVASDTENNKEFSEVEQYLNSFAKDFGMEGVQFLKEYEIYDLSRELEDQLHEVIDEYEEGVFRDKLAYHLARKSLPKNRKTMNIIRRKPLNVSWSSKKNIIFILKNKGYGN